MQLTICVWKGGPKGDWSNGYRRRCVALPAPGMVCQVCLADFAALPPAFSEPASRFIMEGLQNIVRHARARQVWIEVRREKEDYVFVVRDDGRGFDPEAQLHTPGPENLGTGHYGLLGLREQAGACGYLLKETNAETLFHDIRTAARGNSSCNQQSWHVSSLRPIVLRYPPLEKGLRVIPWRN